MKFLGNLCFSQKFAKLPKTDSAVQEQRQFSVKYLLNFVYPGRLTYYAITQNKCILYPLKHGMMLLGQNLKLLRNIVHILRNIYFRPTLAQITKGSIIIIYRNYLIIC